MKIGDIVLYKNEHWMVRRCDPRRTKTATLVATTGRTMVVPYETDAVLVLSNPSLEWPFVTIKERPNFGPLQSIVRLVGSVLAPVEQALTMYLDWVPSDPIRCGGPVFFSPKLGLRPGDMLLAICAKGRMRIIIPGNFQTVAKRVEQATPKPKQEMTAYDHLLGEDDL